MQVLTPYGYGTLTSTRPPFVEVQLDWGAKLITLSTQVTSELQLKVKTFVKTRSVLSYSCKVTSDFRTLFERLRADLELPDEVGLKLYYPRGCLLPIMPEDSPCSLRMSVEAKLVLVVVQSMTWDAQTSGTGLQLLSSGLTARKSNEDEYEHVLANCSFASGSHSWELLIDHFTEHEDLFIGVAHPEFPQYSRPPDAGHFWGMIGTK
jgi:hypothetical protein